MKDVRNAGTDQRGRQKRQSLYQQLSESKNEVLRAELANQYNARVVKNEQTSQDVVGKAQEARKYVTE